MGRKNPVIVFAFVLISIAFAIPAFAGMINGKAPAFKLKDLNGKHVSLDDFKGRVVIIDFWASWCPPCKKEFPELNKFSSNRPDLSVIAINIDKKREHAEGFLSGVPNISKNFHVLLDPDAVVIAEYNARAMPTSFVLDRDGVIRYVHFGFRESDTAAWAEAVDKLSK